MGMVLEKQIMTLLRPKVEHIYFFTKGSQTCLKRGRGPRILLTCYLC